MNRIELDELLLDLRRRGSELDDVEVKAARGGSPKDLFTSICALANRRGGGLLVCGVDDATYAVVGVGEPDRLQRDIAEAASLLEPPVRLTFSSHIIDGQIVLCAEIPEVEPAFRPCYYRQRGPYHGAYIRVGDGDRLMTEYEVYLELSARAQPVEDLRPVEGATLADLDEQRVDLFLGALRLKRPALAQLADDRLALLRALNVVTREEICRPTLAGLLVFGRYPQAFFPSLVVTLTAYVGDQVLPQARLSADVRCEGSIIAMLEAAMEGVVRLVRSRTRVTGLLHETVPEYPMTALREAIVNAVAHRDYSRYAVGTQVQVRFFEDRVEIQSPGGLYGPYPLDLLGGLGLQSTRNAALARLLEDLGPMENRGTGLAAMAEAMRASQLTPPALQDGRAFFRVTLRNESLLSAETVAWLGSFSARALGEPERLALVYARRFGAITNREYQWLNRVDNRQAGRDLKELVRRGLLIQQGARGGSRYVLSPGARTTSVLWASSELANDERRVLEALGSGQPLSAVELARHTQWSRTKVVTILRHLQTQGMVEATTDKPRAPNRRYRLRPGSDGAGPRSD